MRIPPPFIALGAAVTQRVLTPDAPPPGPLRKAAASVVVAGSFALSGSAMQRFHRSGTTVDPVHPDRASALVTGGPFDLTRNPMYVGLGGLLVAHALVRGSWRALPPIAAYVAVIDRLQIPAEEAAMSSRFGDDYEAFRRRVPRWIGLR
jgi:protein-S-isoprenylcysteine O-methyltransferase Ste14